MINYGNTSVANNLHILSKENINIDKAKIFSSVNTTKYNDYKKKPR
jgi:hypothetical protein